MAEDSRALLLNTDSVQFNSMIGNVNIFAPEESNRLFKTCEFFEMREIRHQQTPLKQPKPLNNMMIEEISMVAMKEVRYVNSKQWERMMKRRIKRQMERMRNISNNGFQDPASNQITPVRRYKYESRHIHAEKRIRNQKGRFIPTRPKLLNDQTKGKKKRGRKSKKQLEEIRLKSLQLQKLDNAASTQPSDQKQNQPQSDDNLGQTCLQIKIVPPSETA